MLASEVDPVLIAALVRRMLIDQDNKLHSIHDEPR